MAATLSPRSLPKHTSSSSLLQRRPPEAHRPSRPARRGLRRRAGSDGVGASQAATPTLPKASCRRSFSLPVMAYRIKRLPARAQANVRIWAHKRDMRRPAICRPRTSHMPQPDTVHERKLRPSGRCQHTRAVVVERHTRLDIRRRSACNVQRKQILFSTSEASHLLGLSLQMLTVRLQMPSWNGDIDPSVRFLDKLFVLTISGTADARDDVKSLRKLRTYCLDRPFVTLWDGCCLINGEFCGPCGPV